MALSGARGFLEAGLVPAGTLRNRDSFGHRVESRVSQTDLTLLCDAQTSGGLLISVSPDRELALTTRLDESGLFYAKIGTMTDRAGLLEIVP